MDLYMSWSIIKQKNDFKINSKYPCFNFICKTNLRIDTARFFFGGGGNAILTAAHHKKKIHSLYCIALWWNAERISKIIAANLEVFILLNSTMFCRGEDLKNRYKI